jgi:hypothetical protein
MRLKAGGLLLAALLLTCSCAVRPDPLPGLPRVMLWAWERPEHLAFLDPKQAGVAFLARTISWRDGRVESRPRYQPLELSPGTAVMAVVRLDSFAPPFPAWDGIASEILQAADLPRVQALEIDFDARLSERRWYAELVRRVRRGLRPQTPLTITALASWCQGQPWISRLPIDDAVPMLFRMGAGEPRNVRSFPAGVCGSSLGISMDEIPDQLPRGRRLFIFNPRPWTRDAYNGAMRVAERWR